MTERLAAAPKKVVGDYMGSEAFKFEVNVATIDSFDRRFEECSHQIKKMYPDLDLSKLEKDLLDEEE